MKSFLQDYHLKKDTYNTMCDHYLRVATNKPRYSGQDLINFNPIIDKSL